MIKWTALAIRVIKWTPINQRIPVSDIRDCERIKNDGLAKVALLTADKLTLPWRYCRRSGCSAEVL